MQTSIKGSISSGLDCPDALTSLGYYQSSSLSQTKALARDILTDVMQFRRLSDPQIPCATLPCPECLLPHLSKCITAIEQKQPLTFVLPAFPGKSPNPAKVLGPLPDRAERCALEFLQHLCDRIKHFYSPGAKIILCSDGRVFSDAVGMRDEDVTAYQKELTKMINTLGLTSISTFNLEELYDGMNFDEMRNQLMEQYGESLESLKAAVKRGGTIQNNSKDDHEINRLYCGITRFLVEDSLFPGQKKSRTSIQKECRIRAYKVIQRSQAWSKLIEIRLPHAIRLSIHPQSCGSKKMGIRLSTIGLWPDNWQTPWHGVAVEAEGRFMLLKRTQAESLGAQLMYDEGRPSHYALPLGSDIEKTISKLKRAENAA